VSNVACNQCHFSVVSQLERSVWNATHLCPQVGTNDWKSDMGSGLMEGFLVCEPLLHGLEVKAAQSSLEIPSI
jgi:hypothetical protein